MESYKTLRPLGKGSYGEVFLVKHLKESRQYVVKKMDIKDVKKRQQDAALQEAKLLAKLHHPNIVSYKESFQDSGGVLHIVMGYCAGGDLYTHLREKVTGHLDEQQIMDWFVQITLALDHLHRHNILHRDLKTQNIFLSKSMLIKVGDLGIARVLEDENDMAMTVIGTPYYMSPELFANKPYSFKSDIWSCGCVVYEMATLKRAFGARNYQGLAMKVIQGKTPPVPDTCSKELGSTIRAMLSQRPSRRPSAEELLRLPFIKTAIRSYLDRYQRQERKPTKTSQTPVISTTAPVAEDSIPSPKPGQSAVSHSSPSSEVHCLAAPAHFSPSFQPAEQDERRRSDLSPFSSQSTSACSTQSPRSVSSSSGSGCPSTASADDLLLDSAQNSREQPEAEVPRRQSAVDSSPLASPRDVISKKTSQCSKASLGGFRQLPPAPASRQKSNPLTDVKTRGECSDSTTTGSTENGQTGQQRRPLPQVTKQLADAESSDGKKTSSASTTGAKKLPARRLKKKRGTEGVSKAGKPRPAVAPLPVVTPDREKEPYDSTASGDQSDTSANDCQSPMTSVRKSSGKQKRPGVQKSRDSENLEIEPQADRAVAESHRLHRHQNEYEQRVQKEDASNLIGSYLARKNMGISSDVDSCPETTGERRLHSRRSPVHLPMGKSRSFGDIRQVPGDTGNGRLNGSKEALLSPAGNPGLNLRQSRSVTELVNPRANDPESRAPPRVVQARVNGEEKHGDSDKAVKQPAEQSEPSDSQPRKQSVVKTTAVRTRSSPSRTQKNPVPQAARRSLPNLEGNSRSLLNIIGRKKATKQCPLPPTGLESCAEVQYVNQPEPPRPVQLIPCFDNTASNDVTDGRRNISPQPDAVRQQLSVERASSGTHGTERAASVEREGSTPSPIADISRQRAGSFPTASSHKEHRESTELNRQGSLPSGIPSSKIRAQSSTAGKQVTRTISSPLVPSLDVNFPEQSGASAWASSRTSEGGGRSKRDDQLGSNSERWAVPVNSSLSRLRRADLEDDESDSEVLQLQTILDTTLELDAGQTPGNRPANGKTHARWFPDAGSSERDTSEDSELTSGDDFYEELDVSSNKPARHSHTRADLASGQSSSALISSEQSHLSKLRLASLARTCTEGLGKGMVQEAHFLLQGQAGNEEDVMIQLQELLGEQMFNLYGIRLLQWHRLREEQEL
eukprot:scpid15443/ scgid1913/ Serine/threonine-protein kinase Nek4; Never in mitosis A-related kinase 4; Serine/threonine-protein kinase 2; Serine/threonine-protein kinase NRK2